MAVLGTLLGLVALLLPCPSFAQELSLPKCLGCVSADRILSPGFGIDITTSYAVASVRHHNGTVSALSKVDASDFGRKIRAFEVSEATHRSEQSVLAALRDNFPSVSDLIQSAAQILEDLMKATLAEYRLRLDRVLVTLLPLEDRRLGYEIIHEAARTTSLRLLLDGPSDLRPAPVGAAAAANGIGLCSSFTRYDICGREESELPESLVFGVEYAKMSLTVTMTPFKASRKAFGLDFRRHWDLGSGQGQKDERYWLRIKQALTYLPRAWPGKGVTDIVLMGESATNENFLRVLQDALWEVLPDQAVALERQPLTNRVVSPEYAAAKGAAEMAKRIMEAPDGCIDIAIGGVDILVDWQTEPSLCRSCVRRCYIH